MTAAEGRFSQWLLALHSVTDSLCTANAVQNGHVQIHRNRHRNGYFFFFFEFSVIAKAKFLVALTFTHLTAWWGRFRNPEGSKLTGTL